MSEAAPTTSTVALPTLQDFQEARRYVSAHAKHTPLLTSRLLSERTGFDIRLKAEMFQRTGSYKLRGPLNKFRYLTEAQRKDGVICSSAGNHAQGVALAAAIYKMRAVVVMASNATQSKVDATRAYGAEVVQHGNIWDEANEKAKQIQAEQGLTYIHPFDDIQLITGQGTVGMELYEDFPDVDVVVVPIGGGGLISGIAVAAKALSPKIQVIGVPRSSSHERIGDRPDRDFDKMRHHQHRNGRDHNSHQPKRGMRRHIGMDRAP